MSGRTCSKCRLHDKIELLRRHKRACSFTNCNSNLCASHDRVIRLRNQQHEEREDKGKRWRAALNRTSNYTIEREPKSYLFPEMSAINVSDSNEDTLTVLRLANYETAGQITERNKSKAEKKERLVYIL